MNVTIDVKLLFFIVIGIALLILIIYLIQLMRKLIVTINHTNKIMEDAEVVSEILASRSKDVDGIIDNVSKSVSSVSEAAKGKENVFATIISVVKALASLKGAVTKGEEKKK